MADIVAIKRMLADRAQSVAEMLLPNGRKEGQEWRAGDIGGGKGESLGVHLVGPKAGLWQDFASGDGGDLLDLWVAAKGGPLADAVKATQDWLGIMPQEPMHSPRPQYQRPAKPKCSAPKHAVLEYLRGERAIPAEILARYRVGEDGEFIVFPFLLPDGELAMAKKRKAANGEKPVPTASNCEPILFGWQAISPSAREVVITEGEIDALSFAAYGYEALSVPFGGGKGAKQKWIENDFERLDRFERIYLATDMDKPGDEAAEEIASRLGRHRCLRVKLPLKDANECAKAGVTQAEIQAVMASASSLDPEGLKRASEYTDKVIHLFWPASEQPIGYSAPYGKLKDKLRFRPAEVTLWSGAAGAGKSQILSDCVPHWISEGSRICLASLEMKGEQTLRRMAKQAGNVDRPTAPFIERIMQYLDEGLLLYERVGKAGIGSLLEVFSYARAKYGCDQFIIDSLMRLGIAGDDYTGQEKAVFQIVDWTIAQNVHLHLVAHARKSEKGQGAPETEDIKGAMEIGANAFNIVTVWRNRRHEDEIQAAATEALKAELNEKPGVILNVAKQRNGDFEGKIGLWFDQTTYRYHSSHDRGLWTRRYTSMADAA